jgi:hypothetical protein
MRSAAARRSATRWDALSIAGLHAQRLQARSASLSARSTQPDRYDIDPRNVPSARILERLGFVKEGYLRERWIVAGEKSDTALFGLLRSEWRAP